MDSDGGLADKPVPAATAAAAAAEAVCPLVLSTLSTVNAAECCPEYTRILRNTNPSMPPTSLPTIQQLESLQKDLDVMAQSTAGRAQQLQEEMVKVDAHVKTQSRLAKKAAQATPSAGSKTVPAGAAVPTMTTSTASTPSLGGQTIKLDLKKLKSLEEEAKSKNASGSRSLSSFAKRKREASVDSSMSDATRPRDTLSPAPPVSESKLESFQKKKQKLARERSSSISSNVNDGATAESSSLPAVPKFNDEPSKIKPASQIGINVFWSYVDTFFRNITEEDLTLLEPAKCEDPTPFMIPPLGRHYTEIWSEEDKSLTPGSQIQHQKKQTSITTDAQSKSSSANLKSQLYDDVSLVPEEAYCGPLTERLIAALMEEEVDMISDVESTETSSDMLHSPKSITQRTTQQTKEEMYDLEERLKRELLYVGLLDDHQVDLGAQDNDDICKELRVLQNDLRRVVQLNNDRKSVLYERSLDEMAFQEYLLVLDEINKNVDQAFQKRVKLVKKKKKLGGGLFIKPAPDGVLPILERRRRMLQELDPIFPSGQPRLAPSVLVFKDEPTWATAHSLMHILDRPDPPKEIPIKSEAPSLLPTPALPLAAVQKPSIPESKPATVAPTPIPPAATEESMSTATAISPAPVAEEEAGTSAGKSKPKVVRKFKKTAGKSRPGDLESETVGDQPNSPASTTEKKPRKKYQRKKKLPDPPIENTTEAADVLGAQPTVVDESGLTAMDLDSILPDGAMSMVPEWMRTSGLFG